MLIHQLDIEGAYLIEPEAVQDERGEFARTFCQNEFAEAGLPAHFSQCSLSLNKLQGTLRGIHYQCWPGDEYKLVRCVRGSVYDVLVDLRPESPTFAQWIASELSQTNHQALLIPPQCGHGFLTLDDDTELSYQMTSPFRPDLAKSIRWDDPLLDIPWPMTPRIMSEADRNCPYSSVHLYGLSSPLQPPRGVHL